MHAGKHLCRRAAKRVCIHPFMYECLESPVHICATIAHPRLLLRCTNASSIIRGLSIGAASTAAPRCRGHWACPSVLRALVSLSAAGTGPQRCREAHF